MNGASTNKSEKTPRTVTALASPAKKQNSSSNVTSNALVNDLYMVSGTISHCLTVHADARQHPQMQLLYVISGEMDGEVDQKGVVASFNVKDASSSSGGHLRCSFAAVDSSQRVTDAVADGPAVRVVGMLKMGYDQGSRPYMQVFKVRGEKTKERK